MKKTDLKDIDHLGIDRVLERRSGRIIEEDDDVLFARDDISGAYFLICNDLKKSRDIISKHQDIRLLMTSDIGVGRVLFEEFGFKEKLECYQAAYYGVPPEDEGILRFRYADKEDLKTVTDAYHMISAEEMKKVIERKCLLLGFKDETPVGFIGEHLEGSMGLLYVFPEYRRKSYAYELEKAFIALTMKRGLIPFGQIEKDNEASLKLQEKLGMTVSEDLICWMWK